MTTAYFLWGALTVASLTIALLFVRSWRLSRDRLFLFFALGFTAFAINWLGLAATEPREESVYYVYLPRLIGMALIIAGILDKNRRVR